jgi:uncharacterized membrane protein YozB (DUF420 family)
VPQSQWDRVVRKEWLFLGAALIIGARITAIFLDPGWTKAVLESLGFMTFSLAVGVLLSGGAVTARRVAPVPVAAIVLGTIFEVERHWGWMVAGPLVVLTFLLLYKAFRSGILAPGPAAPSST